MGKTRVTHRDFDAAWANRPRPSAKVMGEHVLLPPQIPAALVLEIVKLQEEGIDPEAEADFDVLFRMLRPVFGSDRVTQWVDGGMDVEQMSDLFEWLMGYWHGDDSPVGGEEEGNGASPPAEPS